MAIAGMDLSPGAGPDARDQTSPTKGDEAPDHGDKVMGLLCVRGTSRARSSNVGQPDESCMLRTRQCLAIKVTVNLEVGSYSRSTRYDEGMTHLVKGLCVTGVLASRTEMDHVICPLLRSSACSTHCDIKRDVTQLLSELRALEIVQAGRHTFHCIVVFVLVARSIYGWSEVILLFSLRCDRLHQLHLI